MGRQDPAARRVSNLTTTQVERKRAIDRANQQQCQQRKKARLQWLESEVSRLGNALEAAQSKIRHYEDTCTCGKHHGIFKAGQRPPSPQDEPLELRPPSPRSHRTPSVVSLDRSIFDISPRAARISPTSQISQLSFSSISAESDVWPIRLAELLDTGAPNDKIGGILFEISFPSTETLLPPTLSPPSEAFEWASVPLHLPADNEIDRLLVELTNSGRRYQDHRPPLGQLGLQTRQPEIRIHRESSASASSTDELGQAQFLSISSLLNDNSNSQSHLRGDDITYPMAAMLAIQIVQSSAIRSASSRIGLMYIVSHLVRWLSSHTKAAYDRIPDFMRPTLLQRTVPHPAWIDIVVWPKVRDNIIRERAWQNMSFAEFQRLTGSLSANWPCSVSVQPTSTGYDLGLEAGDGSSMILTPAFERHIRCTENWTISRSVVSQYPIFSSACVGPDLEQDQNAESYQER